VTDGPERSWLGKAWGALAEEKRTIAFTALVMGDDQARSQAIGRLRELAGPVPEDFRKEETIPF
jgi:hypothetical protein